MWGCPGYPPAHPCEPRNTRGATPWDRTKGWERTAIPEMGCALNICVASAQWSPGDKAGCITLGSNNRTGSEPSCASPGEVWGLGMKRARSTLGLLISVQGSRCTKISVQNQTITRSFPPRHCACPGSCGSLGSVGCAAPPARLKPSLQPLSCCACSTDWQPDCWTPTYRESLHYTYGRVQKKDQRKPSKKKKNLFFRRWWGIQRASNISNSLVQTKKNCSWVRQTIQVFSLFQFYSTA